MKRLLTVLIYLVSTFNTNAVEIKPSDPKIALFQVFAPVPMESNRPGIPKMTFNDEDPLLTVLGVRKLLLAADNKGVLVALNERDTIAFSEITKKFNDKILIIKATDSVMEAIHITAPIEDGYIEFKHPQSAAVAEYLRKRFRVGEFKK